MEINAAPAIANGRVYLMTRDELYCIGKKTPGKAGAIPELPKEKPVGKPAGVRIEPADVVLTPGSTQKFTVKVMDAQGNVVEAKVKGTWSLPIPPIPPLPPKITQAPVPLAGAIGPDGVLKVDSKVAFQGAHVQFTCALGKAIARVRVVPDGPNVSEDFSAVAPKYVPGGWVNAQGKAFVKPGPKGKVLANNNKVGSPLVARANLYLGPPEWTNYTIEADVKGSKVVTDKKVDLPDMGVVACRYRLVMFGNLGRLRIDSWDAIPRVAVATPFQMEPEVWYRMKFKVSVQGKKVTLYGKAWEREKAEPKDWQLEFTDPNPNLNGSPALYRYSTAILVDRPGTEVNFASVKVTPNK